MSTETVIFKLESVLPWEQTSVYDMQNYALAPEAQADAAAQRLANRTGKQVRWNFRGSQQGHYFQPKPQQP